METFLDLVKFAGWAPDFFLKVGILSVKTSLTKMKFCYFFCKFWYTPFRCSYPRKTLELNEYVSIVLVGVFGITFFCIFFLLVRGSPAKRISGGGSFCFGNISIRVEIEDGRRKAKVKSSWLG